MPTMSWRTCICTSIRSWSHPLQFSSRDCDETTGAAILIALKSERPLLEAMQAHPSCLWHVGSLVRIHEPQNAFLCLHFVDGRRIAAVAGPRDPRRGSTHLVVGNASSQTFATFRGMTIWARHLTKVDEVTSFMRSPPLEIIVLHIETSPSSSVVYDCFCKILDHFSSASLTSIYAFQDDFTSEQNEIDSAFDIYTYVWINTCHSFG
jgi:hypothetical protein